MPTVQGLLFSYALHPLPPGRMPFLRWRWELWHGATMIAAGWRLSRPQAARALRQRAAEFGHRLFGLPAPAGEPPRPGIVVRPLIERTPEGWPVAPSRTAVPGSPTAPGLDEETVVLPVPNEDTVVIKLPPLRRKEAPDS